MGLNNIDAVYNNWADLPDIPFRIFVYMARWIRDGDPDPTYRGGWEGLARAAGRTLPPPDPDDKIVVRARRAALKAVNEAIKTLVRFGAIWVKQDAHRGRNAEYGINFERPNDARSP